MSDLPLYDTSLNVETLNIFQPIAVILPYSLPKLEKPKVDSPPKPTATAATPAKPTTASTKPAAVDTYCKACKKKFSNAATFTNHLKSAKHIANEKKLGGSSNKPSAPKAADKVTVNPQVQDALIQLEQAKSVSLNDPNTAVSIYWNQAKALFDLQRPQHVKTALTELVNVLDQSDTVLQLAPSLRYQSQLALSRLFCLYQELDTARELYLRALETKWGIDSNQLLEVANRVRTTTVTSLLALCETTTTQLATDDDVNTNHTWTAILIEAANLFAQEKQTYKNVPCEHIAIVLYGIGSCLSKQQDDFYFLMGQVYTTLPGLMHRVIEIKLLSTQHPLQIFEAMLLSLETDDIVLAKKIQQNINNPTYPDLELLSNLLKKKLTLTEDVDLVQDLKYIELLIDQSMTETLLIGNQTPEMQASTLDRLAHLVMIS